MSNSQGVISRVQVRCLLTNTGRSAAWDSDVDPSRAARVLTQVPLCGRPPKIFTAGVSRQDPLVHTSKHKATQRLCLGSLKILGKHLRDTNERLFLTSTSHIPQKPIGSYSEWPEGVRECILELMMRTCRDKFYTHDWPLEPNSE